MFECWPELLLLEVAQSDVVGEIRLIPQCVHGLGILLTGTLKIPLSTTTQRRIMSGILKTTGPPSPSIRQVFTDLFVGDGCIVDNGIRIILEAIIQKGLAC